MNKKCDNCSYISGDNTVVKSCMLNTPKSDKTQIMAREPLFRILNQLYLFTVGGGDYETEHTLTKIGKLPVLEWPVKSDADILKIYNEYIDSFSMARRKENKTGMFTKFGEYGFCIQPTDVKDEYRLCAYNEKGPELHPDQELFLENSGIIIE